MSTVLLSEPLLPLNLHQPRKELMLRRHSNEETQPQRD